MSGITAHLQWINSPGRWKELGKFLLPVHLLQERECIILLYSSQEKRSTMRENGPFLYPNTSLFQVVRTEAFSRLEEHSGLFLKYRSSNLQSIDF